MWTQWIFKPSTCQLLDTKLAARSWSLIGPAPLIALTLVLHFNKRLVSLYLRFGEKCGVTLWLTVSDCGRDLCMPHVLSELTLAALLQTPEHPMKLNDGSRFSQVSPVQVFSSVRKNLRLQSRKSRSKKPHVNNKQQKQTASNQPNSRNKVYSGRSDQKLGGWGQITCWWAHKHSEFKQSIAYLL